MGKMYHTGYYTGAFDLFHAGHLAGLKKAKALCDKLVVGVSTDEAILNYKHHLPTIPFEERIEIVKSLKCVDKAIPQTSLDNKLEVCQAIGADVLFSCEEYLPEYYEKGHIFTEKEQAGIERWQRFSEECNAHGIDVVYLEREQGISTTEIKEHIVESNPESQKSIFPEEMEYTEGENQQEGDICQ